MSSKTVEEFLSPAGLAQRLSVSRATVWRLVKRYRATEGREGIGPVVMVGKSPRIAASVVNAFLARRTV